MAPETSTAAETAAQQITLALYSYNDSRMKEVASFFNPLSADTSLRFVKAGPAHRDQLWCDIACVLFDKSVDIDTYVKDLATLKLVRKIPIILALVFETERAVINPRADEFATDAVIYLPQLPEQFARTVMMHVAGAKLARQREGPRGDFGRKKALAFGEILVQNKLIDAVQLKKALEAQKLSGKRLGDVCVELGYIDDDQKLQFLSSQLSVPVASAKQFASASVDVVALIPEHVARRYNCVALEKNDNELLVAMTDVLDLRLLDSLRDITELTIKPMLGKLSDLTASIDRFYREISSHKDASSMLAELDEGVEVIEDKQEEVNLDEMAAAGADVGVVKLVNMILANAVRERASDIHIEPQENDLLIRYRIDGDLRKAMSPPKQSHQPAVTRIKILSNLDIAERRLPQDGRMVVKMGKREVDIRVSILPTIFGEKVVMRILDKDAFEKSVTNLGFNDHDLEIFKKQIAKPYGMIIVTGPTGSGKSTTLYSAIQAIKDVSTNIITVEDPVEFQMSGINQVHVNTKIGLTFASALRSILRQDPDVILIGEIRDNETADIAIKMALTGHLVFSTLHTNDAASTIARFVDIGIPPLLLASSLNLIIAQRLVRRICTKCKAQYEPEKELLDQLGMKKDPSQKFYHGEGCVACNGSGFSGRIGLFEFLVISKEIRKLILRNASTLEISEQAEKEGMLTLRNSGIKCALKGDTNIEQVIAATTEI
ncbi:MAG: Flp pilus assembly complex ATPase component TadA [Chitinispirillaceae bacterium]|nr:Flp pilus assembly complex ATPase component TadA [Chitinispirillaceae bacterium]